MGLTLVRVRALWVSGLKIMAGEQTMAGLIGELTGQPLLLTIIPLAQMGFESIAHEAKGRMGY